MSNHRAAAHLRRAKPAPLSAFGNRQSAIGISVPACPVCRKPFKEDEEVGPVPACECSDRGKANEEPRDEPPDETGGDFRYPVRLARSHFPTALELRMDTDEES